jgi:hypothetical protein
VSPRKRRSQSRQSGQTERPWKGASDAREGRERHRLPASPGTDRALRNPRWPQTAAVFFFESDGSTGACALSRATGKHTRMHEHTRRGMRTCSVLARGHVRWCAALTHSCWLTDCLCESVCLSSSFPLSNPVLSSTKQLASTTACAYPNGLSSSAFFFLLPQPWHPLLLLLSPRASVCSLPRSSKPNSVP